MIRTNNKDFQVTDILTADWHLQETSPVCRTDDFWETQWEKVDFVSQLQKQYDCNVLHAGDLFDYWKPSPMLLAETMLHLPKKFYSCYGNHDLPQHSLEMVHKCGLFCLEQAHFVKTQSNNISEILHWGMVPDENLNCEIVIWHVFNYQGKQPWPDCTLPKAASLLRKYPNYKLILTGDNHTPFVEEHNGAILVNPGSLFRLKADQKEYQPRVYLYDRYTNQVKVQYIPIKKDIISSEHIELKKQRDERISAFVDQLNGDWETSLSFEDNLKKFESKNNIRQSVMELVYKSIGK